MSSPKLPLIEIPFARQGSPEAARVLEWKKREGDSVQAGERLVDLIDTAGIITVVAPGDGTLEEIWVEEGAPVFPGEVVASLRPASPNTE